MALVLCAQVHHLGFYETEEAAARCYDAAVVSLRGPGAATNFEGRTSNPDEVDAEVLKNVAAACLPKSVITEQVCT